MKSKLLFVLLISCCISILGYSQCVPDTAYTNLGISGIWPDTTQALPDGTVGANYSQVFTVIVPQDSTVDMGVPLGVVTATITKTTVTGVTGFPTGMSYSCAPANCEYPGNSTGCFVMNGVPSELHFWGSMLVVRWITPAPQ